jgi:hypothetical protein
MSPYENPLLWRGGAKRRGGSWPNHNRMDVDIAEAIPDFTPQRPGQQPTGVLPWAVDPELAERLWHLSEEMTGVKFSS